MEGPFVDPKHEHAYVWVPICTNMYAHRHIHSDSLWMSLFYWPNLPRKKTRRKETNRQGDTTCMEKKKSWDKNILNMHICISIKHFAKSQIKISKILTEKEYMLIFKISIQNYHLELQTENWKCIRKLTYRFVNAIVFPFW